MPERRWMKTWEVRSWMAGFALTAGNIELAQAWLLDLMAACAGTDSSGVPRPAMWSA